MLMQNRLYPHLSHKVIADVVQIIDNYLIGDWVISIEFAEEIEYLNTSWQKWGETFFKVRDSDGVIEKIYECHKNNPLCSIRLHAEKYKPVSNLYYSVCQTCKVSKEPKVVLIESADNSAGPQP